MTKNRIGALFFLLFSSFYFYNVFNIKQLPGSQFEVMTASTFPFYLGVAGVVLSLIILFFTFIEKDEDKLSFSYLQRFDFKTTFLFILAMIFYGFTIRVLGFLISTIIFLAMGFIILKEKSYKKVFFISAGISVGFYLVLNNLLGVYIDSGMFINYFIGGE